jgi:hypothetical protein
MQRFSGCEYLMIDIASNFGLDKKCWDERLAWFDKHQNCLMEMLPEAEEPALYYAGVQAWQAMQRGEPIGYPISLDATSSGLQLLAVLIGDRAAAELCNVVDTGKREDAYTTIYQVMRQVLDDGSQIERDHVKHGIMTSLYGSTKVPRETFGSKNVKVFEQVMEHMAPDVWELNKQFLRIWDPNALMNTWVLPDNFHVRCKVMDSITETVNFLGAPHDVIRKVNMPTDVGRSLGANCIHSVDGLIVREMMRRCSYDPAWIQLIRDLLDDAVISRFSTAEESQDAHTMVEILWGHYETSGYLSARILDYLDSDTLCLVDPQVIRDLLDSLPAKPFQVISVHDCFRCLPNYANDMREQYNRQLYLIAKSDLLSFLFTQLVKEDVTIGKRDESLADDILNANYALS